MKPPILQTLPRAVLAIGIAGLLSTCFGLQSTAQEPGSVRDITTGLVDRLSQPPQPANYGAARPNLQDNRQVRQAAPTAADLYPSQDPVQQASFSDQNSQTELDARLRSLHDRNQELNQGLRSESFIEREKRAEPQADQPTRDLVTKIGLNLILVLTIAAGAILLLRQFQKPRNDVPGGSSSATTFKISEVLNLKNGPSLQIVDADGSRFLVALDGTGIRSVNLLAQSFDGSLDESTLRERLVDTPVPAPAPEPEHEPTPDIDAKLIKMLLGNARSAA